MNYIIKFDPQTQSYTLNYRDEQIVLDASCMEDAIIKSQDYLK